MDDGLLSIYLNDHLAAATAARELVKRTRGSSEGRLASFLDDLLVEIEADRETLLSVMERVSASRDSLKVLAGITAERLGRLKLNGRILERSPLSALTELEALAVGIDGKRSLWNTLAEIEDPRLEKFDFGELVRRATGQRRRTERWRRAAARGAFG